MAPASPAPSKTLVQKLPKSSVTLRPAVRYPANGAANSAKIQPPSKSRKSKPIYGRVAPSANMYPKAPSRGTGHNPVQKSSKPRSAPSPPTSRSPLTKIDPGTVPMASNMRYRKTYINSSVPVAKAPVKIPNNLGTNISRNVHNASSSLSPPGSPSPESRRWSTVDGVPAGSRAIPASTIVDKIHTPPYPYPS